MSQSALAQKASGLFAPLPPKTADDKKHLRAIQTAIGHHRGSDQDAFFMTIGVGNIRNDAGFKKGVEILQKYYAGVYPMVRVEDNYKETVILVCRTQEAKNRHEAWQRHENIKRKMLLARILRPRPHPLDNM